MQICSYLKRVVGVVAADSGIWNWIFRISANGRYLRSIFPSIQCWKALHSTPKLHHRQNGHLNREWQFVYKIVVFCSLVFLQTSISTKWTLRDCVRNPATVEHSMQFESQHIKDIFNVNWHFCSTQSLALPSLLIFHKPQSTLPCPKSQPYMCAWRTCNSWCTQLVTLWCISQPVTCSHSKVQSAALAVSVSHSIVRYPRT